MEEPEWVDAFQGASVADERWLLEITNGDRPHQEVAEDSWTPQNLAELADTPPVQPTLGGLSLVYPGKRHVFSGPQESAKTLAAYVIGLQVVRSGQKVVLIDFEMGPWDAKARLRELGATDEEIGGFLYVEPETPAGRDTVGRLVSRDPRPGLVIIDAAAGAYDLQGLDDNRRADVERFTRLYVAGLWRVGVASIVLDHVTKNVDARGNYAIGSERKVGGADVHLGFSVITAIKRGAHGKYQVTTHKDRGGHLKRGKLATFELSSDPETHHFTWTFVPAPEVDEEHPFRPTVLMEKVSRYLEFQGTAVTIGDVKEMVEGKAEYIISAVSILIEEGFIGESEGPRKARLLESVRAYRETEDDPFPTHSHPFPESGHSTRSQHVPPFRGERVDGDDLENGNGSVEETPF